MELQQFNFLSLDDRATAVWQTGTFLGVRIEGAYSLVLYHMGNFFAEVWYHPTSDEIVLILGFTDEKLLHPYLELIELPRL